MLWWRHDLSVVATSHIKMARSGESSGSVLAAEMAGIDINSDVSSCGDVTGAVTGGAGREIDVVPSARRTSETAYVGDGDGGPAEGGECRAAP